MVVGLVLRWGEMMERGMGEVMVVGAEPVGESGVELLEAEPIAGPDEVFLEGAKDALGVCVSFWVVESGEDLAQIERTAGGHEGGGGGLAAVVTDEQERPVDHRVRLGTGR